MHAALSPYGVIDFASNAVASPDLASMMPPGTITGGPPAYLEAHGIRYVPSMVDHLGSDLAAYDHPSGANGGGGGNNPLFVPMMGDPDGGGPLESSPATGPAVYVSPHELNSRVDERIRRFMEMKSPAAPERDSIDARLRNLQSDSVDARLRNLQSDSVDARLKNLRRDCEMAAQASASGASGAGSAARLRKLQQEAGRQAYPMAAQPQQAYPMAAQPQQAYPMASHAYSARAGGNGNAARRHHRYDY